MDITVIWNTLLTFTSGLLIWVWKEHVAEVKRVQILLNRTREEVAKDYVTKVEVHADINRVMTRLEVLDAKLDRLIEGYHSDRSVK